VRTVSKTPLVLTVAFILSACGGNPRLTKAQYEHTVNQIGKQLSTTLTNTFNSPKLRNPGSLTEAADVLQAGQRNIRDAADRLDRLNPPDQIAGIHGQLVSGFRDFAKAFGSFAQATEKGDLAAIQRFSEQVSAQTLPAMVEIQKAIDGLKAKGFDVSNG
jgi:hypothetical protein